MNCLRLIPLILLLLDLAAELQKSLAKQGNEAVPYFMDFGRNQGYTVSTATVDEWWRESPLSVMPDLVRIYRVKERAARIQSLLRSTPS